MYCDKKVSVVMPVFNEENLIVESINSIPEFIDFIIVVDDYSTDNTLIYVQNLNEEKLICVKHNKNKGVGAAIITGYKKSLEIDADVVVVMAGDGQMNPLDLPKLLDPIINNSADYVKGNRLTTFNNIRRIPKIRLMGIYFLSIVTKFISGYWSINDSQCGFTSISRHILLRLYLDRLYARYGFPIDILTKLNLLNARVLDVPVEAIYNNQTSKLNIMLESPKIALLLVKLTISKILRFSRIDLFTKLFNLKLLKK